jgi:hypothetical protein
VTGANGSIGVGRTARAMPDGYSRETEAEALRAKVLTANEARRIAINMAKLPGLLGRRELNASKGAFRSSPGSS